MRCDTIRSKRICDVIQLRPNDDAMRLGPNSHTNVRRCVDGGDEALRWPTRGGLELPVDGATLMVVVRIFRSRSKLVNI
ncbi:unnamed protein product [Lactuca saligna]|uniref:Uncharacterized protein n=1 Tax=Lactuca saligna TaxID=75948 RepID=A0AA35VM54_LACSI|nr:unnamed protein product [Lactuca saligna]